MDLGPEHPMSVRSVEAFAKIRRETNGQLDISAFPNSALGGVSNIVTQVRSGAVEMCAMPGTVFDTIVPLASMENLGYVFPTRDAALAAMDGDLGALIRAQAADKGMFLMPRIFESGWRDFTSSKAPIRNVTDLDGLKLRVSPGKLRYDTFKSLGASPTTVGSSELYVALQTHIVDAMESSLGVIESFRTYEVQKYCSRSHHMWSGYWTMINLDKWKALPPNFQAIMSKNLDQAALLERNDNFIQDKSLQDLLHRQGLAFNEPDRASFKARLVSSGYYTRWKAEFGDRAWAALEKYTGPLT